MMQNGGDCGQFNLDTFLPYQLNQVAEAVSRAFQERYQKEFNLSRSQWRTLAHLAAQDGLTAKDISARTHEDKVSISRAVAALETRGLLQRQRSDVDKRFEILGLTETGRKLFAQLAARAEAFEAELVVVYGEEYVTQLRNLLAAFFGKLRY